MFEKLRLLGRGDAGNVKMHVGLQSVEGMRLLIVDVLVFHEVEVVDIVFVFDTQDVAERSTWLLVVRLRCRLQITLMKEYFWSNDTVILLPPLKYYM
jgi:hypothetical protein